MIQMKKIRKKFTYLILIAFSYLIFAQNYYLVCAEYNGNINLETYSTNCCIPNKSNSVSENLNTESIQICFEQSFDFCTDTEFTTPPYDKELSNDDLIKKLSLYSITPGLLPTDTFASAPFDYISDLISHQTAPRSIKVLRI